ncbi:MAG: Rho termination factor N-terminal domain-containing protein, partial [Planctomycetota bacterium]|nr:Rho termination factor N-terminal domain-containing protein [Planctomycetota bacterium]
MNLNDLKTRSITELIELANELGMNNTGRIKKQEIIANIL